MLIQKEKKLKRKIKNAESDIQSYQARIEVLEDNVHDLSVALNETRDHVQALLDLNFPNRGRWPTRERVNNVENVEKVDNIEK